jgi:hypothetical protein
MRPMRILVLSDLLCDVPTPVNALIVLYDSNPRRYRSTMDNRW